MWCFVKQGRIIDRMGSSTVTIFRLPSASCGDITGEDQKFAIRKWSRHLAMRVWRLLCPDMRLLHKFVRLLLVGELRGNYRTLLFQFLYLSTGGGAYMIVSFVVLYVVVRVCQAAHQVKNVSLPAPMLFVRRVIRNVGSSQRLSIHIKMRTLRERRSIAHDTCLLPRQAYILLFTQSGSKLRGWAKAANQPTLSKAKARTTGKSSVDSQPVQENLPFSEASRLAQGAHPACYSKGYGR